LTIPPPRCTFLYLRRNFTKLGIDILSFWCYIGLKKKKKDHFLSRRTHSFHRDKQKKFPQVFFAKEVAYTLLFLILRVKKGRKMFKELPINNQIHASELRVIGKNGEMHGVIGLAQALRIADEAELDLVLISPAAKPPVAKIMDYGKFKFETSRKEKEAKKAQQIVKVKEVQLSLGIQENEVAFKMKKAREFILDGDKVKVCINRIRGRATQNAEKGVDVLKKFASDMSDIAEVDQDVSKTGIAGKNINILMVLAPKKKGGK
jgi:translation initiation factor IF-3